MVCEHGGRDWGDVSTSQGVPVIARKPQEVSGEAWNGTPSESQTETSLPSL